MILSQTSSKKIYRSDTRKKVWTGNRKDLWKKKKEAVSGHSINKSQPESKFSSMRGMHTNQTRSNKFQTSQ